jgi:hypothetical protein
MLRKNYIYLLLTKITPSAPQVMKFTKRKNTLSHNEHYNNSRIETIDEIKKFIPKPSNTKG